MVSLHWRPHLDWTVALAFPAFVLSYRARKCFDRVLRFTSDRNEWYVWNSGLQHRSQLIDKS